MALIPGVGYQSTGSTVYWVKPGGGNVGTTIFNPSAPNPFSGQVVNIEAFRSRYGANTKSGRYELSDGTICMFPVDAESIGILTRAMALAAKQGGFKEFTGTPDTHTMEPTYLEVTDYAATHPDGGRSLMQAMGVGGGADRSGSGSTGATGALPGRPRIERVSSTLPGVLSLTWITSSADRFELNIETEADDGPGWTTVIGDPKQGNTRKIDIEVPDNIFGPCVVKVRGYRGGTYGAWSLSKRVEIKKGEGKGAVDKPDNSTNPLLSDQAGMNALRVLASKYSRVQILEALEKV
jgi:hypothetical protein